jgi:hypothetical protein
MFSFIGISNFKVVFNYFNILRLWVRWKDASKGEYEKRMREDGRTEEEEGRKKIEEGITE